MPDREKVIEGLRICSQDSICDGCPYIECCSWDAVQLLRDALALLKEQEAAEPVMKKGRWFTVPTCRKCGCFFTTGTKPNYCSNCGQAVKWG